MQALLKGGYQVGGQGCGRAKKISENRNVLGGRHRRAAQPRDERASRHSMTSSARRSSGIGTLIPSALEALRLITNSTLVACWTGRSAALSLLRTRPV